MAVPWPDCAGVLLLGSWGERLVPGGCEEDGEAAAAVVNEGDVVGGCGWLAGVVPAADG